MINTILIALLCLLSLALIWQFGGYPVLMAVIAIRKNVKTNDRSFLPGVSIIVPTYNEIRVIKNRIINLLDLDYPNTNYEIIVVDSGSTDGTSEFVEDIIHEWGNGSTSLKLIKEKERNGKASAINLGKQNSKYDIVLVTDANSTFNKRVLAEMIPHFEDPKIGAVGGRYCVENPDNSLTKAESYYWDLEYVLRLGESKIGSACLFHGEINAWRKNLVNADVNALSEDLDMCISIRKKGYNIAYEPEAVVNEPSATNTEDQIKQRKRTTIGTIQNLFKHWKYLLLPRDLYSGLIFPSHKTLQLISPFLFLAMIVLYLLILDPRVIILQIVLTLTCFIVLLSLFTRLKTKLGLPQYKLDESSSSLNFFPKLINYVLLNEYLILIAWKDFIFKRYTVLWEKVESSR